MQCYPKYKESGLQWIDRIPVHWKLTRYKYVCNIQNGYPFDSALFDPEIGFPLIRIRNITSGKIDTYYIGEYSDQYVIKRGDLLIAMDGDFNIRSWDNVDALLNQRCCVIKPQEEIVSIRYLYYLLPFDLKIINDLIYSNSVKHLSINDIYNRVIALPPLEEQIKIAEYLDYQINMIDQLIHQKDKLLELLKEKEQSFINETVTKGLNLEVKMVNSGVEWLGYIPNHWEIAKIGHYVQIVRLQNQTSVRNPHAFEENFIPWITTINEVGQSDGTYADDLQLLNVDATSDSSRISGIKRGIPNRPIAIIPLNSRVNIDFLFYFLNGFTEARCGEANLQENSNWSIETIKSIKFPLPPLNEQIEIANFIRRQFSAFNNIILLSNLQIEKLKEYRQSIIFEAITGKMDVRNWQPNQQQVA